METCDNNVTKYERNKNRIVIFLIFFSFVGKGSQEKNGLSRNLVPTCVVFGKRLVKNNYGSPFLFSHYFGVFPFLPT
jgi:hypothetical protein